MSMHHGSSSLTEDIKDKYDIDPVPIGAGFSGSVSKARNRETGEVFALKSIRKSLVKRREFMEREVDILLSIDHPNIIKLVDLYEDEDMLYLVMELCTGGEMFERIMDKVDAKGGGRFSERDAALLMRKILDAVDYCHRIHHICHRDLKPENLLFKTHDEDAELKIIDFGLSRRFDYDEEEGEKGGDEDQTPQQHVQRMDSKVGTTFYLAPEIVTADYTSACDLWSCGVIMYILVTGLMPFSGKTPREILRCIDKRMVHGHLFKTKEWEGVSVEARDLCALLLARDPRQRPTASQALQHPWFDMVLNPEHKPRTLTEHLRNNLRRFVGMKRFCKLALAVVAGQLTEKEIGQLRDVFEQLDNDHNGAITLEEFKRAAQEEGLQSIDDEVMALMEGMDLDGNHTIDYQEFIAASMEKNVFIREKNIRRAFRYFDKDGNGQISFQELVDVMGSEDHAREVVGDVDLDGDGAISYDEFKSMMERATTNLHKRKPSFVHG